MQSEFKVQKFKIRQLERGHGVQVRVCQFEIGLGDVKAQGSTIQVELGLEHEHVQVQKSKVSFVFSLML